ncbi:MAG: SusF/SusE family outer membrane protein [Bacteroidia bacterium]|nr:SusF/SusE family outer membrane protein [Bacteroidia bacterium]MBT8228913.1 SusF/SusE family outer membrane protein [Bacteroidia bacterium]
MKKTLLLAFICSLVTFGLNAQITSVGIIGSATQGAWDNDTDMIQNDTNPDLWNLTVVLTDGECKFRADDDWVVNWGSAEFPMGVGVQDGDNIPVVCGKYDIDFNSATGEYNFTLIPEIGIIGSATPNGWDSDIDMCNDPNDPNKFYITIDLVAGEAKFRKDDDWAVNWGSPDFPTGIGVQDGDNILVDKAGEYFVMLDTMTGAYSFEENITYETIGIIGDATEGGWDTDTDLDQDANDANLWSATVLLNNGEAKFRANDDWEFDWGNTGFPMDTALLKGPNIPIDSGNYIVSFNTETLIYNFIEVVDFTSIGIIGDATPGGWTDDTDMNQDPDNNSMWNLRIVLADGEAKFRADDDWLWNWGSGDFPAGIGELDGANIPVTAGEYIIDFNSITGAYNFKEIIVFDTVGIIGTGSEFGNWDDDVLLEKDPDNEFHFSGVVNLVDGEIKFRANQDWTVNWGEEAFPMGVGTQDGPNILCVGGTYKASILTDTGEYGFTDPSSTVDIVDPAYVNVYPNPTEALLNIDLSADEFSGNIHIMIYDLSGRKMYNQHRSFNTNMTVDVSDLPIGTYFLQINSEKHMIGKKFNVIK